MLVVILITKSVIKERIIILEIFFALDKEKQTAIINAALQCFAKFGYIKASVFQYFWNKNLSFLLKTFPSN